MYLVVCVLFFCFLSIHAAPSMSSSNDPKLVHGHASYRSFSLYDLPVVKSHVVKSDLSVVSNAEIDGGQLDGYETPTAAVAKSSNTPDMFVIMPQNTKEQTPELAPFNPIGVVPKFTGSFRTSENTKAKNSETGRPIINPAAYFLEGADLSKIPKPNCRMIGCDGPMANDDDFAIQGTPELTPPDAQCHQTFVPLNGCTEGSGYPVGMVCTICCDCSAELTREVKQSRGFKEGYRADVQ